MVGVFPSPDPVDFAPCERSWVLEGGRLPPIERPSSVVGPRWGSLYAPGQNPANEPPTSRP